MGQHNLGKVGGKLEQGYPSQVAHVFRFGFNLDELPSSRIKNRTYMIPSKLCQDQKTEENGGQTKDVRAW